MAKYNLLKNILPLIEAFEQTQEGETNVENFSSWLMQHTEKERFMSATETRGDDFGANASLHVNNARMFINMYRYAKSYSKRMIPEDSPITLDDYGYLVILYYRGKMTKIQLIEENIHEKSTGMEILKRLLKLELIQQVDNEEDRRSKWVFIAPKGEAAMAKIQQQMYELTTTVSGNLNADEILQLNQLLQKLDTFHQRNIKGG